MGERLHGELSLEAEGRMLDREIFYTLMKVSVLAEHFRQTSNRDRPQSSLGYRPLAP